MGEILPLPQTSSQRRGINPVLFLKLANGEKKRLCLAFFPGNSQSVFPQLH
jgi:hypothetical protein